MKNDTTDQVKHDEAEESRIRYLEARLANALKLRDELLKERPHLHSAIDKLGAKVDENLRRAVSAERERDRIRQAHADLFNECDALRKQLEVATSCRIDTGFVVNVARAINGDCAIATTKPEPLTASDVERIVDAKLRAEDQERLLAELRALRAETARRMAEVEAAVARQKEARNGE